MTEQLTEALAQPADLAGFDERLLFKFEVNGLDPNALEHVPGFDVVSQEGNRVVALFASKDALIEFKRRLGVMSSGGALSRADILYAIERIDRWAPDDRRSAALAAEGLAEDATVLVDVELWPLERSDERARLCAAFTKWCKAEGFAVLDALTHRPSLILYRLELPPAAVENKLLQNRDVRLVDLPPRYRIDTTSLHLGAQAIGPVSPPPANAPVVAVLDTGIVANHPLLAPAVGDAQSFVEGMDASDVHGHGTAVAGLALYGDVAGCASTASFVPQLRIVSGRILGDKGRSKLPETQIIEAVDYFTTNYGTRVFNLSIGDQRKPFAGGHVRGLAVTLDELTRSRGVLFVVSVGNYDGEPMPPRWRTEYPRYLLDRDDARLLDPAPALNVLTVGGLARYEQSRDAIRNESDPAYPSVARRDQPSPFTRSGPGACGAIKPDLVEYAGNYAVDVRNSSESVRQDGQLGELSLSHSFMTTGLFAQRGGTSFAAPKVAHLAAQLLKEYPNASPNLLRALLASSARCPAAIDQLTLTKEERLRLVGYGVPSEIASRFSTQRRVTLLCEEQIGQDTHHFYEVPLPESFRSKGIRERSLVIALAYSPPVRTTRVDYRMSKLDFRLVKARSLEDVTRVFRKTGKEERADSLKEARPPDIGVQARDSGTLQVARYGVRRWTPAERGMSFFIVVTRRVPLWARDLEEWEPYALTATLEEQTGEDVRLYAEVQQMIRQRARQRA